MKSDRRKAKQRLSDKKERSESFYNLLPLLLLVSEGVHDRLKETPRVGGRGGGGEALLLKTTGIAEIPNYLRN